MTVEHETNKLTAENSVPSSGEYAASATEFLPTSGSNSLPQKDVHPDRDGLTNGDLRDVEPKPELGVPIVEVSRPSVAESLTAVSNSLGKEDEEMPAKEEMPSERLPAINQRFFTLRHSEGKAFLLPCSPCQTWKDVETLIRSSFGDDEESKRKIDQGHYELYTIYPEAIIPRQYWDMLVGLEGQKWEVDDLTVRFISSPIADEDNSNADEDNSNAAERKSGENEEQVETEYVTKVSYTVVYYKQNWRGDGEFYYSTTYDDPVVLETSDSDAKQLSVLEEKLSVTLPEGSTHTKDKQNSKRAPKLDTADVVGKKILHIRSPFLLNVLRSIIKYSSKAPSGDATDELKGGEFTHPFEDLFYHKQELSNYKDEATGPRANHTVEYNAECDRHIDLLLEHLEKEPYVQIKTIEANWEKKVPTTTFAGLWLLMKPGSDVYVEENGQLNAYVVESVSGGVVDNPSRRERSISAQSYHVVLWNLIYDGKVLKRMTKPIFIQVFDNERDITSLPVFPVRFQDDVDHGARRKQLIERGMSVFQFARGPAFLEYTGLGLKPGWKMYNRARVVVEHESHPWDRKEFTGMSEWNLGIERPHLGERARGPRCECSRCTDFATVEQKYVSATFSDYDNIDPKVTKELSSHQYMLCMSHMYGFILKDRTYDLLDVSSLVDPRIVENAIDRLVMRPEENKNTIKAIVKTYADNGQGELFSADFIHGKGEGQIFLLHGPPGTGKTLTAESVAEYTKRPLLSITAADLGHEPIELEKNLLRFFEDATNWDAIVLLDEADVYLERRSVSDLRRNSIVSIFLRALDYFQGILFLTTNRVGKFDEAFMSRIHVSIGYERLDDKAREQIWEDLFRKLKEDHKNGGPEIRYEYEAKQYVKKNDEVKKLQWNGREIRNAFQTAVALAVFDSNTAKARESCDEDIIPEVKERHLSQVVSMSAAFKKYITSTHEGIDDSDLAYKHGDRDDKVKN